MRSCCSGVDDLEEQRLHLGGVDRLLAQRDELAAQRASSAGSRRRGAGRCPSARGARRRAGRCAPSLSTRSSPKSAPARSSRPPAPSRLRGRAAAARLRAAPPRRRARRLPAKHRLELLGRLGRARSRPRASTRPRAHELGERVVEAHDAEALAALLEARDLERLVVADQVPERDRPGQQLDRRDQPVPSALGTRRWLDDERAGRRRASCAPAADRRAGTDRSGDRSSSPRSACSSCRSRGGPSRSPRAPCAPSRCRAARRRR